MNTKQTPVKSLIDLYFHTTALATAQWCGQVVSDLGGGFYLVKVEHWGDSLKPCLKLVKMETMATWSFYRDQESMKNGVAQTVYVDIGATPPPQPRPPLC
jgi:hypothetical protein